MSKRIVQRPVIIQRPTSMPSARLVPRYDAYPEPLRVPAGDKLVAPPPNPAQWGNTLRLAPPWLENEERALITIEKMTAERRVPYTQALILAMTVPQDVTGTFALRWRLRFGAGGGRTIFDLDAAGVQQVTIPAEQIRVSVVAEARGPDSGFTTPNLPVEASAFFADGSTATDPPTYSVNFSVGAGQTETFAAPNGAVAFRISGNPQAVSTPYATTMRYDVLGPSSVVIDRYLGDYIEPIRYTPFPFSGQAVALQINSSGPSGTGFIVWDIDL